MTIRGDRRILGLLAVVTPLAVCAVLIGVMLSSERTLGNLRDQRKELSLLRGEYLALKGRVDAVEGKKALVKVKGIVQAIDELLLPMGLKQKIKSVKPTAVQELKDATEETAEVQIERVDVNEAVNIFFGIENAPMALAVKKTTVKSSFDSPAHLNITMVLALIKPK